MVKYSLLVLGALSFLFFHLANLCPRELLFSGPLTCYVRSTAADERNAPMDFHPMANTPVQKMD